MAYITKETVTITGSSDPSTGYSAVYNGFLYSFTYVAGTGSYANGWDLTVTTENSSQSILALENASTTTFALYPRTGIHTSTGGAVELSTANYAKIVPVPIANERLKFVVSAGGSSDSNVGSMIIFVEGSEIE